MVDLGEFQLPDDLRFRLFAGEKLLFQRHAQNIFVLAAHLPARTGGNGEDVHLPAALPRPIRRLRGRRRHGRVQRALAESVPVQIEIERGERLSRAVAKGKAHRRAQRAVFILRLDGIDAAGALLRGAGGKGKGGKEQQAGGRRAKGFSEHKQPPLMPMRAGRGIYLRAVFYRRRSDRAPDERRGGIFRQLQKTASEHTGIGEQYRQLHRNGGKTIDGTYIKRERRRAPLSAMTFFGGGSRTAAAPFFCAFFSRRSVTGRRGIWRARRLR